MSRCWEDVNPEARGRLWSELAQPAVNQVANAAVRLSDQAGVVLFEAATMMELACRLRLEELARDGTNKADPP